MRFASLCRVVRSYNLGGDMPFISLVTDVTTALLPLQADLTCSASALSVIFSDTAMSFNRAWKYFCFVNPLMELSRSKSIARVGVCTRPIFSFLLYSLEKSLVALIPILSEFSDKVGYPNNKFIRVKLVKTA